MKKILIAGGAGFIGYHLAKMLSDTSMVYIFDDYSNYTNDKYFEELNRKRNVNFRNLDLSNLQDYNKIRNFDIIYYLADINNFNTLDSSYMIQNNINSLYSTLKNFNFKKLVYVSTCDIYYDIKRFKNDTFPENKAIALFESYIANKITCENIVINYCQDKNINYNIARFGNVFGEKMPEYNPIYQLIKKAIKYKVYFNIQNPDYTNTYHYVEDAVTDLITIADGYPDGIFNIASEESISNKEIVELLEILNKENFRVKEIKKVTYLPSSYCPDLTKFKYYFEQQSTQFAIALKQTYKWYRKEGIFNAKKEDF
jgi:nucleoside-diphosphate-sugar epimerase